MRIHTKPRTKPSVAPWATWKMSSLTLAKLMTPQVCQRSEHSTPGWMKRILRFESVTMKSYKTDKFLDKFWQISGLATDPKTGVVWSSLAIWNQSKYIKIRGAKSTKLPNKKKTQSPYDFTRMVQFQRTSLSHGHPPERPKGGNSEAWKWHSPWGGLKEKKHPVQQWFFLVGIVVKDCCCFCCCLKLLLFSL